METSKWFKNNSITHRSAITAVGRDGEGGVWKKDRKEMGGVMGWLVVGGGLGDGGAVLRGGCWVPGVPASRPKSQRQHAFAWLPPSVSSAPCAPVQGGWAAGDKRAGTNKVRGDERERETSFLPEVSKHCVE